MQPTSLLPFDNGSLLFSVSCKLNHVILLSVINQTAPAVAPNDCLVCSILNLIFCNLLLGVIAVIISCMTRSSFDGDKYDAAFV